MDLKKAQSWHTYLRLIKAAAPYWPAFIVGLFGTILATGTDAVLAWAVKPLVDNGLVKRDPALLKLLPFIVVAIFVVRAFTYFLSNYYIARVGRNVVRDFRQNIFNHLMHLPASFYDKETSGKLLSLIIYNTEQVAAATTDALLTILQEGFTLIGLLIVMFILSWQLTLLFMVTAPLLSLIIRYNTKRLRRLSKNVQQAMGDLTHIAEECIEGYRVVRIFGGENYEKAKFTKAAQDNRNREMKVILTNSLGTSIVQIVAALPIAGIIYIATLPTLAITVGGFGALIAAMLRLLTPVRRLTKINTDIQRGIAGAQSIFELLDTENEKDLGIKTLPRVQGVIEYQNVTFCYPGSKNNILENINFKIEAGKTFALVGKSGSGKSSLVSLLPRFYEVQVGKICIDGINIEKYKLSNLRSQFAMVSQHLTLFNDTIANNIAYGCQGSISKKAIIEAARAAFVMDFVNKLPEGLDTLIGENGLLLSGGQRQRIAIARALLKDAPILILDEATSALDTESERHIQAALELLMQKRTTLVIAHRLSTVERADKILVLEQGKIVEAGSHQELLRLNGLYAKLYKMQFAET